MGEHVLSHDTRYYISPFFPSYYFTSHSPHSHPPFSPLFPSPTPLSLLFTYAITDPPCLDNVMLQGIGMLLYSKRKQIQKNLFRKRGRGRERERGREDQIVAIPWYLLCFIGHAPPSSFIFLVFLVIHHSYTSKFLCLCVR